MHKILSKVIPLLIAGVLLVSITQSAVVHAATLPEGYTSKSEVVDLGWTTYANSSKTVSIEKTHYWSPDLNGTADKIDDRFKSIYHEFKMNNSWDFELYAGTILPVNLTIAYPTQVSPGEEVVIFIGVERLPGAIFMDLSGSHMLNMYHFFNVTVNTTQGSIIQHLFEMSMSLRNLYDLSWNISVKTPIGEVNKTFEKKRINLGVFTLELYLNYTRTGPLGTVSHTANVSITFNASLIFDVYVEADTLVIGNVSITGTALENEVNKTLVWDSEGVKNITIGISENATENDTVETDVTLKYVVKKLRVVFYNVSMKVYIDEEEVSEKFSNFIDKAIGDHEGTQMKERIKQRLIMMLKNIIERFVKKPIPLPIKKGKTEVRHKPPVLLGSETNNLESSSPYSELVALMTSITIEVGETMGGGLLIGRRGLILIAIGVLIGVVALVYAVRRGNNR